MIASDSTLEAAKSIVSILRKAGHSAGGLKFSAPWRAMTRSRLDQSIAGYTHIVCAVDGATSHEAWFAYVVGLCRGKSVPLTLLRADAEWRPDPWLDDILSFDDSSALLGWCSGEAQDWAVREERRMAKAALLELGISWHAESLAQCVREGDVKAVDLFLDSGFPPDVRDKNGVPLLCVAARSRHRSVIELLLDRGAFIDAQADDRGYTALLDAAQQGDQGILELLLEKGSDPNIKSKDGQTALILSVGRNDAPMVKALLENGADPDLGDKLGLSARKYAKLFNHPAVVALFDERPASP